DALAGLGQPAHPLCSAPGAHLLTVSMMTVLNLMPMPLAPYVRCPSLGASAQVMRPANARRPATHRPHACPDWFRLQVPSCHISLKKCPPTQTQNGTAFCVCRGCPTSRFKKWRFSAIFLHPRHGTKSYLSHRLAADFTLFIEPEAADFAAVDAHMPLFTQQFDDALAVASISTERALGLRRCEAHLPNALTRAGIDQQRDLQQIGLCLLGGFGGGLG